jgi:bacterioferritin
MKMILYHIFLWEEFMIYKSNKPYPVVQVEGKNPYYASLLISDYSGNVSENTAIHLYSYQSFISEDFKAYKEIMLKIAEVEMIHLRLLGETITQLGSLPIYGDYGMDHILRLWSAGEVSYETSFKEMLELDIEAETQAIDMYQYHLTLIQDSFIQNLIKRIIEDEEIHLSIFHELYHKYFQS